MNFYPRLPGIIASTATVAALVQPQPVLAQKTAAEIREIAEAITVRIDGPGVGGSGFIVKQNGNTYTVLTNWHVVDREGNYTVKTAGGRQHRVAYSQVRKLPGADLAILYFRSSQRYRVAELGDSDDVDLTQTIYVAGWLNPLPGIPEPSYSFIDGKITSILLRPNDLGYSLVYNTPGNYKGMSGGPVLDEEGGVVGINGQAAGDSITGTVGLYLAIPINTFEEVPMLLSWRFETSGNRLAFTTAGPAQPRAQLIADPVRLVIDLPGMLLGPVRKKAIYSGAIREIRVGQVDYQTARIVVELARSYTIDPQQVKFQGNSPSEWTVEIPNPEPIQRRSFPPRRTSTPRASAPEPASANGNTLLRDIEVTDKGIVLRTNGETPAVEVNSPRGANWMTLDLPGVILSPDLDRSVRVNRFGINYLRVARLKGVARVTLDLSADNTGEQLGVRTIQCDSEMRLQDGNCAYVIIYRLGE